MKKKIFCTLGPSTLNSKFLKFANKKINLLRLNMSHVNVNKLDKLIKRIKRDTKVPICIDTEGAQIRTKVKNLKKVISGQKFYIYKNKGNFKICMSGGSSSWVNGRQSPTVCSRILPTEIANSIGISYSNGSYDVNYSGGSMSGAGGFAPGPGNSNQTVVGKFDQSTKEKIQNQLFSNQIDMNKRNEYFVV